MRGAYEVSASLGRNQRAGLYFALLMRRHQLAEQIVVFERSHTMSVTTSEAELTRLYSEMASHHLTPLWNLESAIMPLHPTPRAVPWLWKWANLYEVARRSGELVPVERGGDRRAIALSNPGLKGEPYATPTLWAAVQWLNGREVAPAHRHVAQAVRFILDGRGAYSTVEGDKVYLERGDFVLNPPWLWHDHGSDADEPAIWMDGLDIPLTNFLDSGFFEPSPSDQQMVTQTPGAKNEKHSLGYLRPAWEAPSVEYPPISTYKWADTERALLRLAQVDASPFDDVALEYTNPHTGGPVMKTMTGWVQLLRPGVKTRAHRQVTSAIYCVFEGAGSTIVEGIQFDWQQGDMFAIPSWALHEHHNASSGDRAILFSLQDTPVMRALGKYREEAYTEHDGHQPITGVFDGKFVG
jgi:gentisate 1,2-dioxygenase